MLQTKDLQINQASAKSCRCNTYTKQGVPPSSEISFSLLPLPDARTFGRSDLQTPLFAAGGKVMNAIVQHESGYCGELSPSSMTKNYLEAAVEIAQEAGKILVEELSRPLDLAYKGDEVDLVTQADKRSEKFIVERLTKYFPEHAIAAEEGTGHESASASEFRWHVDPLD